MQKEIIEKLASKYELTISQIESIIKSQGELIVKSIKEGKTVKVSRWGKFVKQSRIKGYREGTENKIK